MRRISAALLLLIYLGVYGNQLALWEDSDPKPLKVFHYQLQLYPQADQQALRQGIAITSPSELCQLLEDYFS